MRKCIAFLSLAALTGGVASLAGGVSGLLGQFRDGQTSGGGGAALVLIGLSSWIVGICLAKRVK